MVKWTRRMVQGRLGRTVFRKCMYQSVKCFQYWHLLSSVESREHTTWTYYKIIQIVPSLQEFVDNPAKSVELSIICAKVWFFMCIYWALSHYLDQCKYQGHPIKRHDLFEDVYPSVCIAWSIQAHITRPTHHQWKWKGWDGSKPPYPCSVALPCGSTSVIWQRSQTVGFKMNVSCNHY